MRTIEVKKIIKVTPQNWEYKYGIRVFFDHEENLFDEFANRNSRPVKEYRQIIHKRIIPELAKELKHDIDNFKYRVISVTNQYPNIEYMNIKWLPRTAYCIRLLANRDRYPMNYEFLVKVYEI